MKSLQVKPTIFLMGAHNGTLEEIYRDINDQPRIKVQARKFDNRNVFLLSDHGNTPVCRAPIIILTINF